MRVCVIVCCVPVRHLEIYNQERDTPWLRRQSDHDLPRHRRYPEKSIEQPIRISYLSTLGAPSGCRHDAWSENKKPRRSEDALARRLCKADLETSSCCYRSYAFILSRDEGDLSRPAIPLLRPQALLHSRAWGIFRLTFV